MGGTSRDTEFRGWVARIGRWDGLMDWFTVGGDIHGYHTGVDECWGCLSVTD